MPGAANTRRMISSSELAELLDFFGLGEDELDDLAGLRPIFEEHGGSLVDAFYAHLRRFSTTSGFLQDDAVRQRLLAAQGRYLVSLADPVIDEQYAADAEEYYEKYHLQMREDDILQKWLEDLQEGER